MSNTSHLGDENVVVLFRMLAPVWISGNVGKGVFLASTIRYVGKLHPLIVRWKATICVGVLKAVMVFLDDAFSFIAKVIGIFSLFFVKDEAKNDLV